jgi:putative transposase
MSAPDRTAMLDRVHPGLSIRRQCRLLGLARSNVYRAAPGGDTDELVIMRRLDELFLAWPFFGSRRMTAMLRAEGHRINRKRVRRLMRLMGLTALGPRPQTSKPAPGHKIYPYLLRGLVIERANQVWAADITYVPIGRGFLYLVAIMDWASRAVLAWRLSNTLDADFCVRALEEALARFGTPQIFNTDQGSQFTSTAFTAVLQRAGVQISMDGRGRWLDNVFIERLWRSLKYEEVYLKSYADGREARAGIAAWIVFYNGTRPHQALDDRAPMTVWRAGMTGLLPANAVDMTLQPPAWSLDDASASPTSPPRQPQQACDAA